MPAKSANEQSSHDSKSNLTQKEKRLAHIVKWQCLNCGQHIFVVVDSEPPDVCEYCQDITTWQIVEK